MNYCQVLLNKIPAKVPVPSPSHHLSHHAIESNHHRKQRLSQHHHLNQDSYYAQPNRSRVRLPVGLGFSTKISAYKPTFPKGRVLLGHARGAPVLKHYPTVLGLRLRLQWMQPSLIFSASLFSLPVRVALKLLSLRTRPPRSCRFAAFSMTCHTNQRSLPYCIINTAP